MIAAHASNDFQLNIIHSRLKSYTRNTRVNPSLIKTEFKKPLFFGDEFQITVSLKRPPTATLEFVYHIVNQFGQKVCEGNTVLAFLSSEKNCPIRCPKFLLDLFT